MSKCAPVPRSFRFAPPAQKATGLGSHKCIEATDSSQTNKSNHRLQITCADRPCQTVVRLWFRVHARVCALQPWLFDLCCKYGELRTHLLWIKIVSELVVPSVHLGVEIAQFWFVSRVRQTMEWGRVQK